jgi:hypothetical protein
MPLPSFLQLEPGTDYIRLTGHRIGLAHVVRVYNDGVSAEMIATYFPTPELPLVYDPQCDFASTRCKSGIPKRLRATPAIGKYCSLPKITDAS